MIGKMQIKKLMLNDLKSFVKPYGYKLGKSGGLDAILVEDDELIKDITIMIYSEGLLSFSFPSIRYKHIEENLLMITNNTEYNGSITLELKTDDILLACGKTQRTIKTEQDVLEVVEIFKQTFVDLHLPALKKFSDPQNVLELWDSLETTEQRNNYMPGPDKYTKILFFSKMVNDARFEERCRTSLETYSNLASNKAAYIPYLKLCEDAIEFLKTNDMSLK